MHGIHRALEERDPLRGIDCRALCADGHHEHTVGFKA